MNATQITDGGLVSTTTFWEVSIPLVVASIVIPVAFSGLLIRIAVKVIRSSYEKWLRWRPFFIAIIFIFFNIASAVVGGRPLFWIVWTLNLLYTIEFLMWVPETYRRVLFASQSIKDVNVARRNYMSRIAARASNYATGSSTARDSSTSRDSGETVNSWATANSRISEDSWVTAHFEVIEGSSIANSSNISFSEAREDPSKVILRKQLTKTVLVAFASYRQVVIIVGGLGLGIAFLILDIFYPKARGLSVYHSFTLWMSLASIIDVVALKTLKYIWRRAQITYEMYEARRSDRRRRRRGSNASQSERTGSIASDGAV